jgi:hypothetical protein
MLFRDFYAMLQATARVDTFSGLASFLLACLKDLRFMSSLTGWVWQIISSSSRAFEGAVALPGFPYGQEVSRT